MRTTDSQGARGELPVGQTPQVCTVLLGSLKLLDLLWVGTMALTRAVAFYQWSSLKLNYPVMGFVTSSDGRGIRLKRATKTWSVSTQPEITWNYRRNASLFRGKVRQWTHRRGHTVL